MDLANQIILVSAALITFAIFAGVLSSRIGAPLLLVFLAFGMLAGEDGIGGIVFSDFRLVYLVGSVALAVILFDGGLRTTRDAFGRALVPALVLATIGVFITTAITGAAAHYVLGYDWLHSLLIGAIVGPTDAAAVFLLLHLRGLRLRPRVKDTLEIESGVNDPMSIFLTMAIVGLIVTGLPKGDAGEVTMALAYDLTKEFLQQMIGGIAFGLVGGHVVLRAVNRLKFSAGIYPIFTLALALVVFATAQSVGASGFLAIYLVGTTLGNNPHRATTEISRFLDGLSWLAQIAMFLMMGLLSSPSKLIPILMPALLIAGVLIFVARPVAVYLSILPLKFKRGEVAFISWVGLRGAVPIFLATIPVIGRIDHAETIFGIAFISVLASLVVQGWTISVAAKITDVELPPRPQARARVELALPVGLDRSVVAYTVDPMSLIARRRLARMPLSKSGTEIISVMRDGQTLNKVPADGMRAGDVVMLVTGTADLSSLDRLFAARKARKPSQTIGSIDFTLSADANAGEVADMYGFLVTPHERDLTLSAVMHARLGTTIAEGARVRAGTVDLVALSTGELESPRKIGLDLDPPLPPRLMTRLRVRIEEASRSIRELFLTDPNH
ncbi:MAG: potassium/proton antiporter [Parvibaculaceae bacterium]